MAKGCICRLLLPVSVDPVGEGSMETPNGDKATIPWTQKMTI
jgi:hypothetical protein